jgi:hypothetical protein
MIKLRPVGEQFTFVSPYQYGPTGWTDEAFAARQGTIAEVIGHITEPDEHVDEECLPMYRIKFLSDGEIIEAWPEEVQ